MILPESTETLIEKFRSHPGIEGEDVEFKSKDKVSSTSGREDVVRLLSAFANNGGGSLILGVENDGEVCGFGADAEVKRDLSHVAQPDTRPMLTHYWEFSVSSFKNENVMRIDVRNVRDRLIQFQDEERGWLPYHRVNDTTVPMEHDQIEEFYQRVMLRHEHDLRQRPNTLGRTEDLPVASPGKQALGISEQYSPDRIVSQSQPFTTVVPYTASIEAFDKRSLYDLSDMVTMYDVGDVKRAIEAAATHLAADLSEHFNYTIKEETYQWSGKEADRFLHDVRNFGTISQNVSDIISASGEFGEPAARDAPHMFACSKTEYGVFWIDLLPAGWDNVREETDFFHAECGLLLDDIPFDDESLHAFFDVIGGEPGKYRQRTGTQKLRFYGNDTVLNGIEPFDYQTPSGMETYASINNPLYGRESELRDTYSDDPLPEGFAHGLSAVDKLLCFVSGGIADIAEEQDCTLSMLDCIRLGERQCETYLVYANATAATEPNDGRPSLVG